MARHALIVVALAVVCSSCVPKGPFRSSNCSNPVELARHGLTCSALHEQLRTGEFDRLDVGLNPKNDLLFWPYRLTFIEFRDNGTLFDPGQVDRAVEEIRAAKADAQSLDAVNGKAIVAVFVHGWKNNASDDAGNVWGFRQVLAGLSRQFAKDSSSAGGKVPVVGIYVGWRGATVNAPIVEQFTYWDRRRESQNLPKDPMKDALRRLMQEAKGPNYDDSKTLSVMVGHSFGGAVLETALAETLKETVDGPGHRIKSPADLVVFLNEAQEALRSYPLIESLIRNGDTQDHCAPHDVDQEQVFDPPAIVSISSTGDYATRAFYPFAQIPVRLVTHLQTLPQPDPLGFTSERPMFFNTTAHSAKFQSHLLEATAAPPDGTTDQVTERVDSEMKQALTACTPFVDLTLNGFHYLMVAKPGSNNNTPYWVMQMPTTIVPDHSTIFTPVFRNFLIALLLAVTL